MWHVYGLVDPRDGWVFYVGCTKDVKKRLNEHCGDSGSSAHEYCKEIIARNTRPSVCVFGTFSCRSAALHLEKALIVALPQVYNRGHWKRGWEFWTPVRMAEMRASAVRHRQAPQESGN